MCVHGVFQRGYMDARVRVFAIFLGATFETVLPLERGTSLVWNVKNFFGHTSMLVLIVTYLFLIDTVKLPSKIPSC